jgi:5-enolpyruvylshikimate-3-phosphate synthase
MTWPAAQRRVRRSDTFDSKAKSYFPMGGSTDGRPSFELFERLVLRGAAAQLARQFDELPVSVAGVPAIRHVMSVNSPFFPAFIIYAMLLDDGVIEMIDLEVDTDYMHLIADDPDD